MEQRQFHLRLACQYQGSDNEVHDLMVEVKTKEGWQALDLNINSPGFLVFCYGIMACQHLYMRTNAKERGITLQSTKGSLDVVTSIDWIIEKVRVRFDGVIASGKPSDDDINYIIERMGHCPSTVNLREIPDFVSEVFFS